MPNNPSAIFYNGNIHTMNDKHEIYQAMAIINDKILSLGSTENILSLKGNHTKIYNLNERTVIPGLIDTHTHIFSVGLGELHEEKFIPCSIDELLEHTKKQVKVIGPGEWVYFHNTYPTRLKEYRFPTIKELDSVAPNNPVYVDGAYAGQANTCLLNLLDINNNTPDPPGGKFIKDKETGKLTGLLFRCNHIVREHYKTKTATLHEIKKGFENIQTEYNKLGITSVIEGSTNEANANALNELYEEDRLSIRTVLTGMISPDDPSGKNLTDLKSIIRIPSKWGKLSFAKITLDGGILTGTAYMRKPYNDKIGVFGIDFDNFKGIIQYNAEELVNFIDTAFNTDLQMTAHCIGDGATDILLDAYELYQNKNNIKNKRYSIIHCDFTDDKTLERIKNLGLSILFQPAWHYVDANVLNKVLDKETMDTFLPYNKFVGMNIKAASGSDHMIKYDPLLSQNPYNPYHALYNMVSRKTRLGNTIGADNTISRYDALAMYTKNASYASFDEDVKGTLEVGKVADFVALSCDYFNCPVEDIKNISSCMTVVGGKIVHSK
jgi:predicted amidohydrolase YtcJ